MKTKAIVLAMCLTCLSTPACGTGLLEAKIAAVAGVAKGAALLGAKALATKGALLKGAGSLLAAKAAAIKNVVAVTEKPVKVPVPSIVLKPPAVVETKPCVVEVPEVPVVTAEVPVMTPSVTSLLIDKLNGLMTIVDNTLQNKISTVHVKTIKSPIVYEILRKPKLCPVPCY